MLFEQISQLLRIEQHEEKNGEKTYIPIDAIVISENVTKDAKALVTPLQLGNNPVIVCDITTNIVLGNKLGESLEVQKIVLEEKVKATDARVKEIRKKTSDFTGLIAVGSGTINDLCKYASHLDNKNYCVFATAPSMNGYASANATVQGVDGLHRSFPAHLPKAIFIDTKILTNSPKRLIASGFADVICRSTVQSDWLLSHLLLNTEYNSLPFEWLEDIEENLLKNARWLEKGDKTAITELANALILSGIGMFVCEGSYPASQGEHLIAHTMEMLHGRTMKQSFHGEQIAVTTLTMAKLQEVMLEEKPVIEAREINEQGVLNYFGTDLGHHALNELEMKFIDQKKARKINTIIDNRWDNIKTRINNVRVPYKTLEKALELVGAPTKPEDIGWNKETYRSIVKHAFLTRNRFTFLDLAYYSGKLDQFVDSL